MRYILYLLILSFGSLGLQGQSTLLPHYLHTLSSPDFERLEALVADSAGAVYACGYFRSDRFEGGLSRRGDDEVFLAKYDSSGQRLWLRSFGGPWEDQGLALALSEDGQQLWVSGVFRDKFYYNRDSLVGQGQTDIFVLGCDTSGAVQRAWALGGSGFDYVADLQCRAGRLYLTGQFEGRLGLSPQDTLSSQGAADIFLLRYDTSGQFQAGQAWGSAGFDAGQRLYLGQDGAAYLGGYFSQAVPFGAYLAQSQGQSDGFLLRFEPLSGQPLWLRTFGGTSADNLNGICGDSAGRVYASGHFVERLQTNTGQSLLAEGEADIFLGAWDSMGQNRWLLREGGLHDERPSQLLCADNRFLYLTGAFEGLGYFGPDSIISRHNPFDAFILKYNTEGQYKQFHQMGGVGSELGLGLALGPKHLLFTGGVYQVRAMFPDTLFAQGGFDAFVAAFRDTDTSFAGYISGLEAAKPSIRPLQAYPNPIRGGQMLHWQAEGLWAVEIWDLQGRLCQSFSAQSSPLPWPEALPSGLYLLHLRQGSQRLWLRMVQD